VTPGPRPKRPYKHDSEKHRARKEMIDALNALTRRGESLEFVIRVEEKRREAESRCILALTRLALPYLRACRHCLGQFYSLNPRACFCKPAHKAAFNRRKAKRAA
jgi:hypothetical protein